MTCDLCLEKLTCFPKILSDSPVDALPGSQLRIQITRRIFRIIWNVKIVNLHAYWDQEKLYDEKNRKRKISWHCPFKTSLLIINRFALFNLVDFHLKVYGIPYTRTYTEFRGIPQYWTVKNSAELCEIKSIPYKIPYSAEFQKGTSENTLVPTISYSWISILGIFYLQAFLQ